MNLSGLLIQSGIGVPGEGSGATIKTAHGFPMRPPPSAFSPGGLMVSRYRNALRDMKLPIVLSLVGLLALVAIGVSVALRGQSSSTEAPAFRPESALDLTAEGPATAPALAQADTPRRSVSVVEEPAATSMAQAEVSPPSSEGSSRFAHLDAKYKGAKPEELAAARRSIEAEVHKISKEVLDEYFLAGAVETAIVPAGGSWNPGSRPYAWAEQVRSTTMPDGSQRLKIAGFSQQLESRTSGMFEEMLWLGDQLQQAGALGLLEAGASDNRGR